MKADEDAKKLPADKEGKGTKAQRKTALAFYLNDCLRLGIVFKDYSTKSAK